MRFVKYFSKNLIICILIKLLLEYIYINYITIFSYEGYTLDYNITKYIIGFIGFLITFMVCNYKKTNISLIINLFFLTYVVPNIVFYSLTNHNTGYFIALISSFNLVILCIRNSKKVQTLSFGKFGNRHINIIAIIMVLACLIHYIIVLRGNFVLSFRKVYEFRAEFDSAVGNGLWGYINSIVPKILLVYLLSTAVFERHKKKILLYVVFFFLLFIFSGHKGVLKGIPLILFFYYLFRNKTSLTKFYLIFLFFYTCVFLVGTQNSMVGALLIRRLLFVPVLLNFKYFEFFSNNVKIYWSESILKSFIDYPYDLSSTHVIGAYLGDSDVGANTGYVASGYMNCGYIGILIYTLILIYIFNVINAGVLKFKNIYTSYALVYVAVNSIIISSDLFTSMLTHGVFVLLLIFWFRKSE